MAKCSTNSKEKKQRWSDKVDTFFDKVSDALSRADEKLTDKINSRSRYRFKNLFAVHEVEKVFSEWMREFHIQQNDIQSKAKDTRDFLAGLKEEDSQSLVRALNGDIDPLTLSGDLRGMYDNFRKMIDANAQDLVDLGVLKEKNAIKDYLKRFYSDYIDANGGANIYFSKKFKARKEMSLDERLAKGMIEDASFVIPKTIAEQKIQALKAQILKSIAERFGKDEAADGYARVPDDTVGGGIKRYGALAGKYVPEEIMGALRATAFVKQNMGIFETMIYPLVDHIKVNVTVKNPATHVYNVGSNFLMAYLHGDMRALGRVLLMANKNKAEFSRLVDEANKYGLNTLLDDMEHDIAFDPNKKPSIMLTLLKNLYMSADSKSGKGMRRMYEWEDKIFKLAAFEGNMKKMREELGRDLSDTEKRKAFKEANEAYVDYDTPLPVIIRAADKSGLLPFLHYTWKSTPVVAKAIAKSPLRFALLQAALIGIGASAWFGDDEDTIKPSWASDQLNLTGSKEWIDVGNGWFLNGGRLVPGMKLGKIDLFGPGSSIPFSGGFVGGVVYIATGKTPLGYNIGNKYDSAAQSLAKRAAALAENYAPPLSPIGRYGQRVEKKALGDGKKNSSTGEEMGYKEIMAQPVGLRKFDPKHEAQSKANAIENRYKWDIKNGKDPAEAATEYRNDARELRQKAAGNHVVGLKLSDSPPKKKEHGGIGRVNIVPRLKLN